MKRITPRSTAAAVVALAIAAVGTPLSSLAAQTATLRSGYAVTWGKTAPAPAAAGATERTSSGYMVTWARSGYMVAWGKDQPVE